MNRLARLSLEIAPGNRWIILNVAIPFTPFTIGGLFRLWITQQFSWNDTFLGTEIAISLSLLCFMVAQSLHSCKIPKLDNEDKRRERKNDTALYYILGGVFMALFSSNRNTYHRKYRNELFIKPLYKPNSANANSAIYSCTYNGIVDIYNSTTLPFGVKLNMSAVRKFAESIFFPSRDFADRTRNLLTYFKNNWFYSSVYRHYNIVVWAYLVFLALGQS